MAHPAPLGVCGPAWRVRNRNRGSRRRAAAGARRRADGARQPHLLQHALPSRLTNRTTNRTVFLQQATKAARAAGKYVGDSQIKHARVGDEARGIERTRVVRLRQLAAGDARADERDDHKILRDAEGAPV